MRLLVLTLIGLALLAGCGFLSPVSVRNCVVRPGPAGALNFRADVTSETNTGIETIYISVTTIGSYAEYQFRTKLDPHATVTLSTTKSAMSVTADAFSRSAHLRPITSCYPHAVIYEDGSHSVVNMPI